MLIVTAVVEHLQGRLWKCECPRFVWTSNAWGSLTSQTFFDPYSFTHLLHGFMFAGMLLLLGRFIVKLNLSTNWRLVIALALEVLWEILETPHSVMYRYRAESASPGYR